MRSSLKAVAAGAVLLALAACEPKADNYRYVETEVPLKDGTSVTCIAVYHEGSGDMETMDCLDPGSDPASGNR